MRFDTRHWHVPHPDRPTEGAIEGRPTPQQYRAAVERATKARAEWKPSPEAWQQLLDLHALIGQHIRIQFWNPIMMMLDEEGPNPLYAQCVGITTYQADGVLQPCLLLEDLRELKTPEGGSSMGYAMERVGYAARLAPVADIYEIEAVTTDGYEKAVRKNTPRQNRVNPFGEIIRDRARGTLMGNRGRLHNEEHELVRQLDPRNVHWKTCMLEFNGRKRRLMAPGQYTELFFLDEATALAAGHRPCAECRRERYDQFIAAWQKGNPGAIRPEEWTVDRVDSALATERMDSTGNKATYRANLDDLPDGTMVLWPPEEDTPIGVERVPVLVHGGVLRKWRPKGYTSYGRARRSNAVVRVLTPRSIVNALKSGYSVLDLPRPPGTVLSSQDYCGIQSGENGTLQTEQQVDPEMSVDNLFFMLDGP
jgi:hypothetical protein